jgi:beta-glucosidase
MMNQRSKKEKILKFPKGFLWGTATSAHQVEGNNFNSDWWKFEEQNKILFSSGKACDSYNRFKDDHDLIEKMNNNAYRLSIEWAKIEPEKGKFDHEVMKHYVAVLSDLKKRNIKVMLTLHHFSNPFWFFEKKGWTNPFAVYYFKRYVNFVVDNLGGLVDLWITINEPGVYTDMGYDKGLWPPMEMNYLKAFFCYINMAIAHRISYALIKRKIKNAQVGFAMNVMSFASYRKHRIIELLFVHFADRFINHSFYDLTKNKHDFLAINYYFRVRLKQKDGSLIPEVEDVTEGERELSDVGWLIYPHGLYDVLMDMEDFKKPIYITENGIAAEDDRKREKFLVNHISEIYHAMKGGVDVRGYFHWSLLDNFEWEKGFGPKFGLVEVDRKTFERKIKPSGELYGKIAKDNFIEEEMVRKYEKFVPS